MIYLKYKDIYLGIEEIKLIGGPSVENVETPGK
jgi:hypothetical protein